MRSSTNILGVVAVAGLAYAAGSAGLFRAVPVVAAPQEGRRHAEGQHEQEHEHD